MYYLLVFFFVVFFFYETYFKWSISVSIFIFFCFFSCFSDFFGACFSNSVEFVGDFWYDQISLVFCVLAVWSFFVSIVSSISTFFFFEKWYYFNITLLFFFMIGTFIVSSPIMFYIFFESVLIPIIFIIVFWGSGSGRFMAGIYMFMYTIISSVPLFIFSVWFFFWEGVYSFWFFSVSFNYFFCVKSFFFWFWIVIFCFIVKLPIFVFHFWLPKAHVESPTTGSMILAAVILKMGSYGMIRFFFFWSMFFNHFFFWWTIVVSFFMIMSIVSLFVTFLQVDIKRMIAFSSVCHMSIFGVIVFISGNVMMSALLFMVMTHGIISSLMFFISGTLHSRFMKNRLMWVNRGVSNFDLILCYSWLIAMLMYSNSPGFGQFVTEIVCSVVMLSLSFWVYFFILFLLLGTSMYVFSFFISISIYKFNSFSSKSSFTVLESWVIFIHFFFCVFFMFFFVW